MKLVIIPLFSQAKKMPWEMFPVKHPQCIRLQLNTELQPGRNCKENAKEKKHYN